jgi:hypothetical protein
VTTGIFNLAVPHVTCRFAVIKASCPGKDHPQALAYRNKEKYPSLYCDILFSIHNYLKIFSSKRRKYAVFAPVAVG